VADHVHQQEQGQRHTHHKARPEAATGAEL
jgi:hypothetical protein